MQQTSLSLDENSSGGESLTENEDENSSPMAVDRPESEQQI